MADVFKVTPIDLVHHSTLLEKLAILNLPDEVYNWLKNYFDGHSHSTRFGRQMSTFADIFAIVIQGSGVGPSSYIVCATDLHPLTPGNKSVKYADDTYLIIPSSNSQSTITELEHIEKWSTANNLKLNHTKTVEILFVARGIRGSCAVPPPPLPGIARVDSINSTQLNRRLRTQV